MKITKMLAPIKPNGPRSGRKLRAFKGVTIHNTGNSSKGAGAISHGKYLQGANNQASWHYAVDDKNIVQSIPENEVAWHAGDGSGNGNHTTVAIEICMNPESDIGVATDRAAALTADILKRHGKTTAKGYVFQHNNWSGKNCPQMIRQGKPYSWDAFMRKVENAMKETKIKEVTVAVGTKTVKAKLIDGVTYTPLRDTIEAIKSELDVTWDKARGAGVGL